MDDARSGKPSSPPLPARSIGAKPRAVRPRGRPPPVREVAAPTEVAVSEREVKVDDVVWKVHQKGAGRVGYGGGYGPRILSVGVQSTADRREVGGARYLVGRTLADVAEEDLVSMVREVARTPDPDADSPGRKRRRSRQRGRGRARGGRRRGPK